MSSIESTESSIGFDQYRLILKRRWLPTSVVFCVILFLSALGGFMQKPVYEAEGKLLFKKTSTTSSLTGLGQEIGRFDALAEQSNPLKGEGEVIRSVPIIQKTIAELRLKDEKDAPLKVKQFLKKLQVANIEEADILSISYKDRDPKQAKLVVNTLITLYIENNQRVNRTEVVSARQFIEKQLPQAETSLRQAEASLRRFKEQNKIVALQEEASSAVEVIAELQKQMAEAQSKLADVKAQSETLQDELRMNTQQALTATSLSQSPAIQDALKEYQQVERELAVARIRFQDVHPTIVDLKEKEATLKALLKNQIQQVPSTAKQVSDGSLQIGEVKPKLIEDFVKLEAQRQGYAKQVSALSNVQAAYKQRLNVLPKLEQEQRQLESKLQASQSTYSLLLQKLQEIRIAENQNVGNARIVQAAFVPEEPIAPRKSLFLVMGVFLSSLLAIATALLLEATDTSIRTVEEARTLFGFSILGVIPFRRRSEKITLCHQDSQPLNVAFASRDTHDSSVQAAYWMLQANLQSLCSNKNLKTIVVSSSVPKEGKSVLCANLAIALAQLGRKVLLIDANLHSPVQHCIWKLPNQLGFSDVISGQAALITAVKEVIVNLDVLTSGTISSNLMVLLDFQKGTSLIEECSANYELIIIDTPSLKAAADALILGKIADGMLFVVRPGVVDSASAVPAREAVQRSGQNVLGQVVNGVVSKDVLSSFPVEAFDEFFTSNGTHLSSHSIDSRTP